MSVVLVRKQDLNITFLTKNRLWADKEQQEKKGYLFRLFNWFSLILITGQSIPETKSEVKCFSPHSNMPNNVTNKGY